MKHNRLIIEPMPEESKGFTTAAFKHCCACGEHISAMGGGGTFICVPCTKLLTSGYMAREFQAAKKEQQ